MNSRMPQAQIHLQTRTEQTLVAEGGLWTRHHRWLLIGGSVMVAASFAIPSTFEVLDELSSRLLLALGAVISTALVVLAVSHQHYPAGSTSLLPIEDDDDSAEVPGGHSPDDPFDDDDHHTAPNRSLPPPRIFVESAAPAIRPERYSSLTTLAVGLGHDVGNSVLPILCHLDSLLAQDLSAQAQKDLHAIRESAMALRRLSAALSVFALDPEDAQATGSAVTNVQTWWREIEPIMRRALPADVTFESDIPQNLPLINAPAHHLTQSVLNLIVNAGEALGDHGHVRCACRMHPDGTRVQITVTDNGRGMSDDVRRQALHPFFTTKTRGLSTGLGLSQVNAFVQNAGGRVDIRSKPRIGTTVTMTLNVVEGPDASSQQRGAVISIHNPRLAAHARALLGCFGFQEVAGDIDSGEDVALLIVEPANGYVDSARSFLRNSGRRVIVHGTPDESLSLPGVIVTDGSHRSLHQALQRITKDFASFVSARPPSS